MPALMEIHSMLEQEKFEDMIPIKLPPRSVDEYFQRVKTRIEGFAKFYGSCETILGYVPPLHTLPRQCG